MVFNSDELKTRKQIRMLLIDAIRYSMSELLSPLHPLVIRMEKEDPYSISIKTISLAKIELNERQQEKLTQDIRLWCREEYGSPGYSDEDRIYIKKLTECIIATLK